MFVGVLIFFIFLNQNNILQQTERGSSYDDPLFSIKPDIRGL